MHDGYARPRYQPAFKPLKSAPRLPRRDELAATNHQESTMPAATEPQATASKDETMIRFIAEHKQVTTQRLATLMSIDSTKVNGLLGYHVIKKRLVHNNGAWSLASGLTLADFRFHGAPSAPKPATKAKPSAKALAKTKPAAAKPSAPPAEQTPSAASVAPVQTIQSAPRPSDQQPRFRVARTSDRTLMLFGIAAGPIELTTEQTDVLVNFLESGG